MGGEDPQAQGRIIRFFMQEMQKILTKEEKSFIMVSVNKDSR